jgi:hypothetical protein
LPGAKEELDFALDNQGLKVPLPKNKLGIMPLFLKLFLEID